MSAPEGFQIGYQTSDLLDFTKELSEVDRQRIEIEYVTLVK